MQKIIAAIKTADENQSVTVFDPSYSDAELLILAFCNGLCSDQDVERIAPTLSYPVIISADLTGGFNVEISKPENMLEIFQQISDDFTE